MNIKNNFWWFSGISFVIIVIILTVMALFLQSSLSLEEKDLLITLFKCHFGYIFIAIILLVANIGTVLYGIFHNYIIPIRKLDQETNIYSENPFYHINIKGNQTLIRITEKINQSTERYKELQKETEKNIQQAKTAIAEEKNIFDTFMAELSEGVIICNINGEILFYNKQAKSLFENIWKSETSTYEESNISVINIIGLGYSLFEIMDKSLILHAIEEIREQLRRKKKNVRSHFVVMSKEDRLMRVEAIPVLSHQREFTGFILIIYDITQQMQTENRIDFFLQSFLRNARASLASIRSAIEAIREYPNMDTTQLNLLSDVIHKESVSLSDFLNTTVTEYSLYIKTQWPLIQTPAKDLFETVRRKAQEKLGIICYLEKCDEATWIKVDSYSIIMAMLFVISQLKNELDIREFNCNIEKKERFVSVDLIWQGSSVNVETLRSWDDQVVMIGEEKIPFTLKEVIKHHDAEIWCHSRREYKDQSYFRFFLPAVPEI